jgi:hypothetical protein
LSSRIPAASPSFWATTTLPQGFMGRFFSRQ